VLLKAIAAFFTKKQIDENRDVARKSLAAHYKQLNYVAGARDKEQEKKEFEQISKTVKVSKPALSIHDRRLMLPNQMYQDEKVVVTDEALDDWMA
jgi:hypothetical protein